GGCGIPHGLRFMGCGGGFALPRCGRGCDDPFEMRAQTVEARRGGVDVCGSVRDSAGLVLDFAHDGDSFSLLSWWLKGESAADVVKGILVLGLHRVEVAGVGANIFAN